MELINDINQLHADHIVTKDAYVIPHDLKLDVQMSIELDRQLVIIGNVTAGDIHFVSKVMIYGDLIVSGTLLSGTLLSHQPLVVKGKIITNRINSCGYVEANNIECYGNIDAKIFVCKDQLYCGGNFVVEHIKYVKFMIVKQNIHVESNAIIASHMIAGKNIIARHLIVGGNINAKSGYIHVESVSAGTDGYYQGHILCKELKGTVKTGTVKKSEPVKLSKSYIKKTLGIDDDTEIIFTDE